MGCRECPFSAGRGRRGRVPTRVQAGDPTHQGSGCSTGLISIFLGLELVKSGRANSRSWRVGAVVTGELRGYGNCAIVEVGPAQEVGGDAESVSWGGAEEVSPPQTLSGNRRESVGELKRGSRSIRRRPHTEKTIGSAQGASCHAAALAALAGGGAMGASLSCALGGVPWVQLGAQSCRLLFHFLRG